VTLLEELFEPGEATGSLAGTLEHSLSKSLTAGSQGSDETDMQTSFYYLHSSGSSPYILLHDIQLLTPLPHRFHGFANTCRRLAMKRSV
jgi:hypothetical protein